MLCLAILLATSVHAAHAQRDIYLDNQGVVRWRDDQKEVSLFGANYVLPTASDYRAAGYLRADRKKMIDEDMAQFARMGWDGLRLTFWGDWEASDSAGNLIANDHLDPAVRLELAGRTLRYLGARLRAALRQGPHGHRPCGHRGSGELSAPDPESRESVHACGA